MMLRISILLTCIAFIHCTPAERERPNIIYILADDLGYGELGCYGQKLIETPNIDALAKTGMRFTQHYSGAPVCAPARCILLTGRHAGHAFVRGNDEWGSRGKVWDYDAMYENPFLEGQRPLPDSVETIAERLQTAGYATGMVGKWGLGAPTTEGVPNRQGFDFFYGYNCQRQAHTYYPRHLWHNEERDILQNKNIAIHANLAEGADPNNPSSYDDFNLEDYAPTLMHDQALSFIDEHKGDPFFLYYASPIPHLPLQAPKRWVDHYRKKLGPEDPYTGTGYFPTQYPKATYAAMISYLDEQVGDLVDALKTHGVYENTLIIFTSDNGPTYTGGADTEFFKSATPFRCDYGRGKGFTHEGGIRVPMIASWPDKIEAGSTNDHISAFHDVFPTLCEVAGMDAPDGLDGISYLPSLLQDDQQEHEYLYWEFPAYGGQQAVRKGKWKAIRKDLFKGNLAIELYDLENDVVESLDVSDDYPDIVNEMLQIMQDARTEPQIDRFKLEPLGDVKSAYTESVARAKRLKAKITEDYFTLNQNTQILGNPLAIDAIDELQNRLKQTGGYTLKTEAEANRKIAFKVDQQMANIAFHLEIQKNNILLSSSSKSGFDGGIQALFKLMDPSIEKNHEMHNPNWTIACLELSQPIQ